MPTGTGIVKALFSLVTNKVYCSSSYGRDNGFGNNYVWASSLESGVQLASRHKKPVMVIIHKSWCSACKNLKPKFANSSEIQTLSKKFVMVNLVDDEEPENNAYAPDGTYIPRILFVSPTGNIDHEIYNEDGSSQHKFFYSRPEQIAKAMKKVLEKYHLEKFDELVSFVRFLGEKIADSSSLTRPWWDHCHRDVKSDYGNVAIFSAWMENQKITLMFNKPNYCKTNQDQYFRTTAET